MRAAPRDRLEVDADVSVKVGGGVRLGFGGLEVGAALFVGRRRPRVLVVNQELVVAIADQRSSGGAERPSEAVARSRRRTIVPASRVGWLTSSRTGVCVRTRPARSCTRSTMSGFASNP